MNRTRDPERVNSLAGADLSAAVAEPMHVFLEEGDNLGCFVWRGPHTYEIHLAFTTRGKGARDLFWRMIEEMRAEHGALSFWAAIPVEKRNVRMFARIVGFTAEGIMPFADGPKELFVSEKCGCHL